jgi:hypothetical protein
VSGPIAHQWIVFRTASSRLFATMSGRRVDGQRHSLSAGLLRVYRNELIHVLDENGLKKLLKLPP